MKYMLPLALTAMLIPAGLCSAQSSSQPQRGEHFFPQGQIEGGPKHSEMSKRPDKGANRKYYEKRQDKQFLDSAAKGGLAEVQLGELAAQKASDAQVKQFAQRMDQDHGKANQQVKTLAASKGIQLPTSLDSQDQALKQKLSGLSGHQFDVQYMQAMVSDHQRDIAAFQKAAKQAEDQDIKDLAAKTLPTLQDHLKQAQDVLGSLTKEGQQATPSR